MLELADIEHRIEVYPGAGHLFSAFGFPTDDVDADRQSWAAFSALLERMFGELPAAIN